MTNGIIGNVLNYYCIFLINAQEKKTETRGKADPHVVKLKHIKPCFEEWESSHNSCKQYEVKLSRLRIRHTR